ncbi:MAG: hypothetical protein ACN6NX_09270 [Acinetobacter sp.]
MNLKQKKLLQSTAAAILMISALTACEKEPAAKSHAAKYSTVEQASKALTAESEKIDLLVQQLGQAKTQAEEKKLSCEQIPQQYDQMLAIMDANQHLMSASDLKVQAQFKQLAVQQKQRFQSNLLCKTPN